MAGQLSGVGAQSLANTIAGVVPPFIGSSAPVFQPGLVWINTSSGAVAEYWNGTAWVAGVEPLFIALLTGDPSLSGPNGGPSHSIADLIEDTTAGYARQAVTFAGPVPYLTTTTYTLGQQVTFQTFAYQCIVSSSTNVPPTGLQTSNANWEFLGPDYPAFVSNTNVLTYTYTAAQVSPVQFAALVTASSGTTGHLRYTWTLTQPELAVASQSLQAGAGLFTMTVS